MSWPLDGLKSVGSSVAQIVAALAGQAVSMLRLTLTQTTGSDAVNMTTGARAHFGGGTNDYIVSDGSNLSTPGAFTTGAGMTFGTTLSNANTGVILSQGVSATSTSEMRGNAIDGASAIGVSIGNTTALATGGAQALAVFRDLFGTKIFAVDQAGKIVQPTAGNSTGSPGAATLNTPSGRSAIAAGAASVVITNSLVSASSQVYAMLQTADATLTSIKSIVPGAGSFTITGNANATANTNVCWFVVN